VTREGTRHAGCFYQIDSYAADQPCLPVGKAHSTPESAGSAASR